MLAPPLRGQFKRICMERMYHGISYPCSAWIPAKCWLFSIWKRLMCPRGHHLLDEVVSSGSEDRVLGLAHYLHCDACGLTVYIESIEEE